MNKQEFAKKAAIANAFEIETSKLAAQAAEDEEIVEFAQMMVADHTEADQRLREALSQDGASLPPKGLDTAHQEQLEELKQLSSPELDAEYVRLQVVAHDEAVELFSSFSENGEDGPVREFAQVTLPTLRRHQDSILDIFEELGG